MNSKDLSELWLININLGDECNLTCRYCFQKGILEKDILCNTQEIAPRVIELIKGIPEHYNKPYPFRIRFTGGEPLFYFSKLKTLVEGLGKNALDKLQFSIVTNGTLLTEEIVAFFNEYNFDVGISHDGIVTKNTRGVDILEDEMLLELVCKIKNMHFVCVLNALNADYKRIVNYFKEQVSGKRENMHVSINPIYNTGFMSDTELVTFDWEQFSQNVSEYFGSITLEQFCDPTTPEYYLLNRYISRLRTVDNYARRGVNILNNITCGADYNHINIDTSGKVYTCHNCSEVIGAINDSLEQIFGHFNKLKPLYELTNSPECQKCDARVVCNGACPFVPKESRKQYYCQMQKIIVANVLSTLLRLGKEAALCSV